jgi:aminoglycoside 2''-phosphotransferase
VRSTGGSRLSRSVGLPDRICEVCCVATLAINRIPQAGDGRSRLRRSEPTDTGIVGLTALPPLAELKAAARSAWPERRLHRFRVHDGGWANFVLEADQKIIFRFPRRRAVAASLDFEVRGLELMSRHLSVPIPDPIRIAVLSRPRGWPFIAYPKLPGQPLSAIRALDSTGNHRLGLFVGTLLRELAAVPCRAMLRIGALPGDSNAWELRYRRLRARFHRHGESLVAPAQRQAVASAFDRFYLDLHESRYRPVATHQDLGPDHILWDLRSNRPTGVIDWEDLRLGDPAFDLTGLGTLGRAGLAGWVAARGSRTDRTFDDRLKFYRRVVPLHGVIHAAETGDHRWLRKFLRQLEVGFHERTSPNRPGRNRLHAD